MHKALASMGSHLALQKRTSSFIPVAMLLTHAIIKLWWKQSKAEIIPIACILTLLREIQVQTSIVSST